MLSVKRERVCVCERERLSCHSLTGSIFLFLVTSEEPMWNKRRVRGRKRQEDEQNLGYKIKRILKFANSHL